MLKRFLKRKVKSDSGSSALISFLLLVPLFLALIITAVDLSFYFSNRGQVEAVARDAARTVAIFGGDGTVTHATTIEKSYGQHRNMACSSKRADLVEAPHKYIFLNAPKTDLTAVECNVLAALANSSSLVSFSSEEPVVVNCGPNEASSVGTRTYCEVRYTYEGMPGAPLSFIQIRHDDGTTSNPLSKNTVSKSAESEVMNPGLVAR